MVFITRKEHFNAAHKLFKPEWSDDENFALIAYHLRISAFLSADCSDQELYEAIKPITKWRCEHANCAVQL